MLVPVRKYFLGLFKKQNRMLARDCVSRDEEILIYMNHDINRIDNTNLGKTKILLIHKKVYVFKVTCINCSLSRRVQKCLEL